MRPRLTPPLFYGAAAAALAGLALGAALHGPWEEKAGGPRMLFSSAAAADLAPQADGGDMIQASLDQDQAADASHLYDGYLPADPLPVVRLKPDRYPDLWGGHGQVTQASVDEGERVNPDDLYKADVFADDELTSDPADAPPAADETPRIPVRYSALEAAEPNPSF